MKIIGSYAERWHQKDGLDGIFDAVERAARICYASERNVNVSSKEFVQMLVKKDHARCLEFGSVYLIVPHDALKDNNIRIGLETISKDAWTKVRDSKDAWYVSTNLRSIYKSQYTTLLFTQFLSDCTDRHEERHTIHFVCSRGIGDEFRTHVGLSSVMQSTRYCSYDRDKFGNEVTYIKPEWYKHSDNDGLKFRYLSMLTANEKDYFALLRDGLKPQDARGVLGLDVKTELVQCGFSDAWNNFLYRRTDMSAHPDARKLAFEVQNLF